MPRVSISGGSSSSLSKGNVRGKKRPVVQIQEESDDDSQSQDYVGGSEEGLYQDDDAMDMDNASTETSVGVAGLNQILDKLSSQFKERARAKKLKLEEDFKDVNAQIAQLDDSQARFEAETRRGMDELKYESVAITERLGGIVKTQEANEEKHAKMFASLSKSSEQVKTILEESIKTQAQIFQDFITEMDKLDTKNSEAIEELTRAVDGILREIKGKVVKEAMKSETENLARVQFV